MSGARLVLGGVQWGMPYGIANRDGPPDDGELARLLARAGAAGVRAVDTARAYGASEARVGALVPADWAVGTKLAPDLAPEGASAAEVRARGEASLAASRAALRRDRLDAVLLHRAAHRHAAGGAAWALLREERRAGRVARIGVSAASPAEAWTLLADPEVERIQVAGSLLDQRLLRGGFFARARARGVEVQVRSLFLQGAALLAPDALPPALAVLAGPLARIERWASARGWSRARVLVAFAAAAFPGASLVIGAERADQLEASLAALAGAPLTASEAAELAALVPPLPDDVLDPWRWPPAAPVAAGRSAAAAAPVSS